MKILKKLLYMLLGILSLLSIFIIICAFNPKLAEGIADLLYAKDSPVNTENANIDNSIADISEKTTKAAGGEKAEEPKEKNELNAQFQGEESPYIPPEKSNVTVPEEVSGKSGYVPIQEYSEQVDDVEAEKLRNQITYGETGDDLTFDTEFYPYYGMLDSTLQKLYRQIYANAVAVNGIFTPVDQVSEGQLRNVFMAVFNDHPELFWLDSAYRGRFSGNGVCVEIVLQFNQTVDNLSESQTGFDAAANDILNGAQGMGSDYEKEVYVHNALLDRIAYNLQAPLNQNAYSALVNGQTVCAGYARAFQYLMQQLGIPCYYCTGYAGENHAWNIIKMDGEYYNADATWDDTEPNTYNYFNKTDADFSGTHIREDLSINLPPCNGQKYGNLENNETANTGESQRRSLEDIGATQEEIITNLNDYYNDCYNKIMLNGGTSQFFNVVQNEDMWLQCYDAYNSEAYADAYMNNILEELGAAACTVDIQAEELEDGSFLLEHNITFD